MPHVNNVSTLNCSELQNLPVAWADPNSYLLSLFPGDTDWLLDVWANYMKAVPTLERKDDAPRLMNVTGLKDWARQGGAGINATNESRSRRSVP